MLIQKSQETHEKEAEEFVDNVMVADMIVCPSQLHGTTVRARLRLKPLVNRLHTQHRTAHSRTTAIPHYTKILFQDAQKYFLNSRIAKLP